MSYVGDVFGRQVLETEGRVTVAGEAERARQEGLVEVALEDLEQIDRKARRFKLRSTGEALNLDESLAFQPAWRSTHYLVGRGKVVYFTSSPAPVTEQKLGRVTSGMLTRYGRESVKQTGRYHP